MGDLEERAGRADAIWLEPFGREDFDRLMGWAPAPEFLLQINRK